MTYLYMFIVAYTTTSKTAEQTKSLHKI